MVIEVRYLLEVSELRFQQLELEHCGSMLRIDLQRRILQR